MILNHVSLTLANSVDELAIYCYFLLMLSNVASQCSTSCSSYLVVVTKKGMVRYRILMRNREFNLFV